ncbi:peptidase M23 [Fictibacillus macauensis ZFHKF-1]|uniref:Peptidase M23 n=2 Tax=Fictibacillus TaxID=1329200 RepID=I8AHX8_9BACL|nr:peptidase M23 [Fictibacillus macauensis ZFHKF-1]
MRNRADEVRKKYEQRFSEADVKRPYVSNSMLSQNGQEERKRPRFFNGSFFLFQMMVSLCLFLGVGVLFKNGSEQAQSGQSYVKKMFVTEFQFASVKNWYEGTFGKTLALLPEQKPETAVPKKAAVATEEPYAVPASGKVYESFAANGQGIMMETNKSSQVDTVKEGYVVFAGTKEKLGKTVIIQHSNGEESWYGMLESIDSSVKMYTYMKSEKPLGTVSPNKDGKTGKFYFALKKDDKFIDPSKVIRFE